MSSVAFSFESDFVFVFAQVCEIFLPFHLKLHDCLGNENGIRANREVTCIEVGKYSDETIDGEATHHAESTRKSVKNKDKEVTVDPTRCQ